MSTQRHKYYNFNFNTTDKHPESLGNGDYDFILNPSNTIEFPTDSPHRKWFLKMTYLCMEYPNAFYTNSNSLYIKFTPLTIKNSYIGNGTLSNVVLVLPRTTTNEDSVEDTTHAEQHISYKSYNYPNLSDLGYEINYPTFLAGDATKLKINIVCNLPPVGTFTLDSDDEIQFGFTITCIEDDTPGYLENAYDNEDK
jgi:hypothetical protein